MADNLVQFAGFSKVVVRAESYGVSAEFHLVAPPIEPPPDEPPAETVPVEPAGVDRATQFFTSTRGIQGEGFFVEKLSVKVGEELWFDFQVHNTTEGLVAYRILTAVALEGPSAASWTNQDLHPKSNPDGSPNGESRLGARDHIQFATPGTYRLYLGIGHDGEKPEDYRSGKLPWEPLSSAVVVTVTP